MRSKRALLRSELGHFHHDHHLFGRVTLVQFLRDVLRDFHCLFLSRDRNLDGLFGGALTKALFQQELPSRMHQPSRCAPSCVDLCCFGVCRVTVAQSLHSLRASMPSGASCTTAPLPKKEHTHTRARLPEQFVHAWSSDFFVFMVSTVGKKYQCEITIP